MATASKKRHREHDDGDGMEEDRKMARLETPSVMIQDQDQGRHPSTEDNTPIWDSLAAQMQHFSLVSYPPPPTVEDVPGKLNNLSPDWPLLLNHNAWPWHRYR